MTVRAKDRRLLIAEQIGATGVATVDALAARFEVSQETIRRDLARLDAEGQLRKVHGGARPLRLHTEGSFEERMAEESGAKHLIARKLCAEIREGDTIFVDTGSTTLIACMALAQMRGLTVITNSVRNAQALSDARNDHQIYLLGGAFDSDARQTTGAAVLEQINRFQADHAILSCVGLDPVAGVTNANLLEAEIARVMIRHSENVIILCTLSKISRRAAHRVCAIGAVGAVVTEAAVTPLVHEALSSAGVRLP